LGHLNRHTNKFKLGPWIRSRTGVTPWYRSPDDWASGWKSNTKNDAHWPYIYARYFSHYCKRKDRHNVVLEGSVALSVLVFGLIIKIWYYALDWNQLALKAEVILILIPDISRAS